MTFKEAVEAAQPPVNGAYRPGKQAMESRHRRLVTCMDSHTGARPLLGNP